MYSKKISTSSMFLSSTTNKLLKSPTMSKINKLQTQYNKLIKLFSKTEDTLITIKGRKENIKNLIAKSEEYRLQGETSAWEFTQQSLALENKQLFEAQKTVAPLIDEIENVLNYFIASIKSFDKEFNEACIQAENKKPEANADAQSKDAVIHEENKSFSANVWKILKEFRNYAENKQVSLHEIKKASEKLLDDNQK